MICRYICEELASQGDLRSYLDFLRRKPTHGYLNDIQARFFSFQILNALEYIHAKDVVHRDVKPENVLLDTSQGSIRTMLADFGTAIDIRHPPTESTRKFTGAIGTPAYLAPEVYSGSYDAAIDVWAAGALITALFAGDSLFAIQALRSIQDDLAQKDPAVVDRVMGFKAQQCNLSELESRPEWQEMGLEARNLVGNLLVANPANRFKASIALNHSWFTGGTAFPQKEWLRLASVWQDSRANPASPFADIDINIDNLITLSDLGPQVSSFT